MKFKFTVEIDTPTKEMAIEVLESWMRYKKAMKHTDLVEFSKKVEEKPGLIDTAKKWL